MKEAGPANLPASVRQRLLNQARQSDRPFNELLQYFAMERFLYRISVSPYQQHFILKGALMLVVWRAAASRPTLDIDLLGQFTNNPERIAQAMREICQQQVEPDGLVFNPESVQATKIREAAEYQGVRVRFLGWLGKARVNMQIDVGFGDPAKSDAQLVDYPVLLEFPAPRMLGYNREMSIAEKLEALVRLDQLNSRMKDFYDIWWLSRQFDFAGPRLSRAIQKVFAVRGTTMPTGTPTGLTDKFASDPAKQQQWAAFLRHSLLPVDLALPEVIAGLRDFLLPILQALAHATEFTADWTAAIGWQHNK